MHTKRGLETLHQACLDRDVESPFTKWLERWDPDHVDPTTTRIDVGDFLSVARQALMAHATQIVEATDLPVSADLERCFADDAAGAA